MKAADGVSPSNIPMSESYDMDLLDDAAKVMADGIRMAEEAGLDLSNPMAFWIDDEPYMVQRVIVHGSH